MKELLSDRIAANSVPNNDFDTPNWDKKEAFRQGRLLEAHQILDLLSFNEERK